MGISHKCLGNEEMADSGITVKEIQTPVTKSTNTGRTLQMKLSRKKRERETGTHTHHNYLEGNLKSHFQRNDQKKFNCISIEKIN